MNKISGVCHILKFDLHKLNSEVSTRFNIELEARFRNEYFRVERYQIRQALFDNKIFYFICMAFRMNMEIFCDFVFALAATVP